MRALIQEIYRPLKSTDGVEGLKKEANDNLIRVLEINRHRLSVVATKDLVFEINFLLMGG